MIGIGKLVLKLSGQLSAALLLMAAVAVNAHANTIVRISTSMGDFSLELFDTATPVTVQNFLSYVNSGAFNGSYFHRLEKDFILQGGGFKWVEGVGGGISIPTNAPIVNEFGVSNTRGTVAMAKVGGDPDSATSQWFVNFADNSANLDVQNEGFTVFGQVLGDGMLVLDRINEVPDYYLGTTHTDTPLRDFNTSPSLTVKNFITMNAEVVQRYSSALNVFEYKSGLLQATVDGGETLGTYSLNLSLQNDLPGIVFRLNGDSLVDLGIKPDDRATFSSDDNRLRIPSLELNNNGNVSVITNVVFVLTDAANWLFTLESYDQQ